MPDRSEMTSAALTEQNWSDFEQVMGPDGGARGCWCMHWRLSYPQWKQGQGDGNRRRLRRRTRTAPPPGLVCYLGEDPVGWIGIGHRDEYPRMLRSPITRPIDDAASWVISCIYVRRDHRHQRLQAGMIAAACRFAAEHGQHAVDAYPVDPVHGRRDRPVMRRVVA